MRLTTYALVSSLVCFVFLSGGCGGGGGAPGGPGGGGSSGTVNVGSTVKLADVATVAPASICQREVRCGYYPDLASCIAANPVDDGQLLADVQAGRSTFDGAAAATCFKALAALSCNASASGSPVAACDKTVKGTVAAGAACSHDEVCVSQRCAIGNNCDPSATCCPGTCRAVPVPAPVGGDCSNNPCVPEAFCGAGQQCEMRAAAGQPCADQDGCVAGFLCVQTGVTTGTCAAFGLHGQVCNPDGAPCDLPSDYCDPTTMKCVSRLAIGAPCVSNECVAFATCADTATCAALKGPGEACAQDFDCLGSLFCTNGVCAISAPQMICP